jgi:hypothetical protein
MALPRWLTRQIKGGTYKPSPVGKKAREAAKRLREKQAPPPPEPPSFEVVKRRMIVKKQVIHGDEHKFHPKASQEAVQNSDAYDEMLAALDMTNDQIDRLASLAAKAWTKMDETGDAGELAQYLVYDFLWYH